MAEILVKPSEKELFEEALDIWADAADGAIGERGGFTVCLSGGGTPRGFYSKLSGEPERGRLEKTRIFFADERCVPHDHPDSNYRMIKEALLDPARVAPGNVHPVPWAEGFAARSAAGYEKTVRSLLLKKGESLPVFDLMLLGLGEDGHTASLFPGTPAPEETERFALAVRARTAEHERVSLSLPVINAARIVMFMVTGRRKADIVRRLLTDRDSSLPASRVKPVKGRLIFLIDGPAAARLDLLL